MITHALSNPRAARDAAAAARQRFRGRAATTRMLESKPDVHRHRARQQHARRGARRDRASVSSAARCGGGRHGCTPDALYAAGGSSDRFSAGSRCAATADIGEPVGQPSRRSHRDRRRTARRQTSRTSHYWESLTRVLEWAERHTYSTILSCLAAHAGILHLDGIARRPLGDKRFGVYECVRVSDHPLTRRRAGPSADAALPVERDTRGSPAGVRLSRALTRSDDAGSTPS